MLKRALFLDENPAPGGGTAPVPPAPAAPAPAAPVPAAPAEPGQPLTPGGVDAQAGGPRIADALAARRAALAKGEAGEPEPGSPEHHSHLQPRTTAGKFDGPPQRGEEGFVEPKEGEEGYVAPGEEPGEAEPQPGDPDYVAPAVEMVKVSLPGSRPDQDDELEVDPKTAETLQRLKKGYLRGEQVQQERAALSQQRAEVNDLLDRIEFDPVGLMREHVSDDVKPDLVLQVLADPAILEQKVWLGKEEVSVRDALMLLLDENDSKWVRPELEKKGFQLKEDLRERAEKRASDRRTADAIERSVEACLPESMEDAQRELFRSDALRDLAQMMRDGVRLTPTNLPLALEARFAAFGINPVEAAERLRRFVEGKSDRQPGPPAARPVGQQPPKRPAAPPVTGAGLRAAQDRKARLAAVPPQGHIAPSTGAVPLPANQNVKERIAAVRDRMKHGGHLV